MSSRTLLALASIWLSLVAPSTTTAGDQDLVEEARETSRRLLELVDRAPAIEAYTNGKEQRRRFARAFLGFVRQQVSFEWEYRRLAGRLARLNDALLRDGLPPHPVAERPQADEASAFEHGMTGAGSIELWEYSRVYSQAIEKLRESLTLPPPPDDHRNPEQVARYRDDLYAFGELEDLEDRIVQLHNLLVDWIEVFEWATGTYHVLRSPERELSGFVRRTGHYQHLMNQLKGRRQGAAGRLGTVTWWPQAEVDLRDEAHVVQPGDTLWDLARRMGTTVPQLMLRNKILPGEERRLLLGQILRVGPKRRRPVTFLAPDGSISHFVASTDTPRKVARRYGISVRELAGANPGKRWKDFKSGDRIKLPPHADITMDVDRILTVEGIRKRYPPHPESPTGIEDWDLGYVTFGSPPSTRKVIMHNTQGSSEWTLRIGHSYGKPYDPIVHGPIGN